MPKYASPCCGNCRHWRQFQLPDESPHAGICRLISTAPVNDENEDENDLPRDVNRRAVARAYVDHRVAELVTTRSFSCFHFEPEE